jgi:hypothetical protein
VIADAPDVGRDADARERMAATVEWLLGELPGELTVEAVDPDDDPPEEDIEMSRPELLTLIRAGELRAHTRYRVTG